MIKKINWGIIGLGEIAQKFSEGFSKISNAKLLAISSKSPEKLSRFKKTFSIKEKFSFNNYEDLISCKEVDIVYIALPNTLHHFWVIKCIENKKNILVEKPATINVSEISDVNKKLLTTKLFFGEAFMYRHDPQLKILFDIIKNNEIGKLISMESVFGINLLTKKKLFFFNKKKKIDTNKRIFNKELGGGCILDLGCYTTSFSLLINSMINKLDTINFKINNISKEFGNTGVDIHSKAEIFFENGFRSKVSASFKENLGGKSIIHGQKGNIVINDMWSGNSTVIKNIKNQSHKIKPNIKKNIYSLQIENISENLLNGLLNPTFPGKDIKETILNTKIIEGWCNG